MRPADLDIIPNYIGKSSYILGFTFIAGDKLSERVMVGHVERCKDEIYTMFHDIKNELAAKNLHAPIFESYEKYIEEYYDK